MEIAILIVLSLCLVLLVVILVNQIAGKDINSSITNSIGNLSELISRNQERSSDGLIKSVDRLDKNLTEKQTVMNESVLSQLKQFEERLKTLETTNEQKLEAMRATIAKQLNYIQEDNNKKLDEIRITVDEKLQKTLDEKMARSYKAVIDQLEVVNRGLGEMQTLASGVGDLKKVLSNVKTRGIVGEIQLYAILSEILTPEQYEREFAPVKGEKERVEFAIKLPAGQNEEYIYLPIDSKFPGDTYSALQEAYESGDAGLISGASKNLISAIEKCAKDIRDKYIYPPYTTNFAVMFLPFEGLYAEVVRLGLIDTLQRKYCVSIAGPSTMAALLNSLQMGFRTLQIQKKSNEVWNILSIVKNEFSKFGDVLENARKRVKQLDDELEKLAGTRTNVINRTLNKVTTAELTDSNDVKFSD